MTRFYPTKGPIRILENSVNWDFTLMRELRMCAHATRKLDRRARIWYNICIGEKETVCAAQVSSILASKLSVTLILQRRVQT